MKSVLIGASAGLGRALAVALAEAGHELFLVASDERDLDATARDLALRFNAKVDWMALDLREFSMDDLYRAVCGSLGAPDCLFYLAGVSVSNDRGAISDALADDLMTINFTAGVRIANAFLPDVMKSKKGNFVGCGSVAAARARRGNSVYGASKRGLEFYFQTLRHLLANSTCRVQFYRLGYLDTRMTFGQKLPFPKLSPEAAAAAICARLGTDSGVVYLPGWWRVIMTVYQLLPWPVFKRLDV